MVKASTSSRSQISPDSPVAQVINPPASFEAAVMQVAKHLNSWTEGGGRNGVGVASEMGFAFK